jgi:ABC-type molybdate transport system permease subunit
MPKGDSRRFWHNPDVGGQYSERTQTMSMAIYDAVQANNLPFANQLAFLLTSIGFGLPFCFLRLRQKTEENI